FFALTGALQIFSLHEAHGDYTPPPIIEKLSSVHKDQVFKAHHQPPKPATKAPAPKDDGDRMPPKTLLLKVFFLFVALGLTLSTALGLWIGLTHPRNRRINWALAAAGALIPVALILI
ncbi:MAG TPA: hypothetical protein VHY34_05350, partial [Caulobacteraceae bacterium]|nr:hypothetical protein [Caulobacteraceae bacterium]